MGLCDFTVENSTLASGPWKNGNDYWCSFELYPEWKGNMFYVFKGIAHHRREYHTATAVVVKTFRYVDATLNDWLLYKEACRIGRETAEKFNVHLSKNGSNNSVWFVKPTDVVMDNISDVMPFTRLFMRFKKAFSDDEIVLFENYLEGDFKTFVTQNGSTHELGSEILKSFCHFSYHLSGGKHLLNKLKGIREDGVFRLTCPAIHSTSRRFGDEDSGISGILDFFKHHTCTEFCKEFLKPDTERKTVLPSAPMYSECSDATKSKEALETKVCQDNPTTNSEFMAQPPKYESVDINKPPPYESCVQPGLRNRKGNMESVNS